MKNSFILYKEHKEIIDQLTDEQAGQLLRTIFEYEESGTLPDLGPLLNITFIPFRQALDKNKDKYEAVCQRNAKNGAKGGRPKKAIKSAIKKRTPERIKTLIDRYVQVVKDPLHFFDYQWTLTNF